MSEVLQPDEDAYLVAKAEAIEATVAFLKVGDALGKDRMLMAAEYMAAFQQAAEEALGAS